MDPSCIEDGDDDEEECEEDDYHCEYGLRETFEFIPGFRSGSDCDTFVLGSTNADPVHVTYTVDYPNDEWVLEIEEDDSNDSAIMTTASFLVASALLGTIV